MILYHVKFSSNLITESTESLNKKLKGNLTYEIMTADSLKAIQQ